jgi:predicted ATPase
MSVITELSRLESAGLIRLVQYEPELEYLFRHALVQDAAYGTLLTADRKRLHHGVGEAVESLYADRLDELSAMLARHFEQAGDQERALGYYTRAGEAALASYANVEAESLFRSALALPNPPAQRVDLLSQLGVRSAACWTIRTASPGSMPARRGPRGMRTIRPAACGCAKWGWQQSRER